MAYSKAYDSIASIMAAAVSTCGAASCCADDVPCFAFEKKHNSDAYAAGTAVCQAGQYSSMCAQAAEPAVEPLGAHTGHAPKNTCSSFP
jgi:hypothetical protein